MDPGNIPPLKVYHYTVSDCLHANHFRTIEHNSETFEGENFHELVRSDHFAEKTFAEC